MTHSAASTYLVLVRQTAFKVLRSGMGAQWQCLSPPGLRRFGVPAGGPMDLDAARWANRLVGNEEAAPVMEILFGAARIELQENAIVAVTGAPVKASLPLWRAAPLEAGQVLEFAPGTSGVWTYLAAGPKACGTTPWSQIPDYAKPPVFRVWPGPQRDMFSDVFFNQEWTVTPQSNRVGYRLSGEPLRFAKRELLSEPVRVGTIQVPENGLPIITMRDGPTVGGYPKLGMVDPLDLSLLAQSRPGQKIRFTSAE